MSVGEARSRDCLGILLLTCVAVLATLAVGNTARSAEARSLAPVISAGASCGVLAGADRSATNGSSWGETVFPGHNAAGGWFGVDVCANGTSAVNGDSSSVSCNRVPDNWNRTGCAPGEPTSDGYGWTFQCPELVVRFSAWAFGDSPDQWGRSGFGNAPDLWDSENHPADFVAYANGSSVPPVPGDILVWGSLDSRGQPWPAGPDGEHGGHVAVVVAVSQGLVITAEQNVQWGSEDHPSDRLALRDVNGRWILSGSQEPVTTFPTYRWQSTMGESRATYGWLHSVRNTGHFPSSSTAVGVGAGSDGHATSTLPKQPSGGLPPLESAMVVTGNGELADLVWSSNDFFEPAGSSGGIPHAAVRSLAAPPGSLLVAGEKPATVMLVDGSSVTYAVGASGHLYAAYLSPAVSGVLWSDLGSPDATLLTGSVSASTFAGGLGVAALGKDGNVWWRTGVVGQPGFWQEIGRPKATVPACSFVLAGAPGQGTPMILALAADGRIYQRVWQDTQIAGDGLGAAPGGWSTWTSLGTGSPIVGCGGPLVAATEMSGAVNYIGSWPDTPLDISLVDTSGHLWWLRTADLQAGWQITPVGAPQAISSLLGGTVVDGGAAVTNLSEVTQLLHLYVEAFGRSYMVSLPVPRARDPLPDAGDWLMLPPAPVSSGPPLTGVALPLGQDASVIVIASGRDVLVGGSAEARSLLLPSASAGGGWLAVGVNATAPAFADAFVGRAVDARWAVAGTGARVTATTQGLQLSEGSGALAALLQTANAGPFSLMVYVRMSGIAGGEAGLVFYTDDGDWLTLLLKETDHVSMCMEAWQRSVPCATLTVPASAVAGGVWLRVAYQGSSVAGAASVDAVTWQSVGSWSIESPGSGAAMSSAQMRQTLAYTTWGVLARGSNADSSTAWFSDFSYSEPGSSW